MGAVQTDQPAAGSCLSSDEVARFETFGFLHLPGFLADEIDALDRSFEELVEADEWRVVRCDRFYEASRTGCEERPRVMVPGLVGETTCARLGRDPRLEAIGSDLLGEDTAMLNVAASIFSCDTHWHDDSVFTLTGGRQILVMIYLDPLSADDGALRVIPGSHHRGPFRDRLRSGLPLRATPQSEPGGQDPRAVPAHVLSVEPGDVVVVDLDVLHASFGGGPRRRLLTVGFGPADLAARQQELVAG